MVEGHLGRRAVRDKVTCHPEKEQVSQFTQVREKKNEAKYRPPRTDGRGRRHRTHSFTCRARQGWKPVDPLRGGQLSREKDVDVLAEKERGAENIALMH